MSTIRARRVRSGRGTTRSATAVLLALALPLIGALGTAASLATATPAAAAIPVPVCSAGVSISPDPYAANCRMGQAGALMSLSTGTVDVNGYTRGTFTMQLPAPASVCGGCQQDGHYYGSAGISTRLYQPGAAKATYDSRGLGFAASITSPASYDLLAGGTFSGTYSYKDPGGLPGALLVTASMVINGNGQVGSVASDDVVQFGTTVAPPTCTPPAPTVQGVQTATVVLGVAPCANNPNNVDGYRVAAYTGSSSTPYLLQSFPKGATKVTVNGVHDGTESSFTIEAYNAAGSGPASAHSTKVTAPFATTSAFVDRQFRDFAGRAPTAAELSAGASSIATGALTGAAEDASYLSSKASWQVPAPAIRLFSAYFLRLPDYGGLTYWTGRLRGGTTLAAVSASFAASKEFTTRYGTLTNAQFVNLVYQNVLGRAGDAGGVTYWTNQLHAKAKTRGEVMVGFSESAEYKTKTAATVNVVSVYAAMLLRVPTAAEITTWGPQTVTTIVQHVLDLPAYGARVSPALPA